MNTRNHTPLWLAGLLLGFATAPLRAQGYGLPVAVNYNVALTNGAPVTFRPLVNDSDPNNFALTITGVSRPSLGNATWTGTCITYTPNVSFSAFAGSDTFTYTISDGYGMATAQVSVGNPFYLKKGNYAGTLNNPGGGFLTLATTASGAFTGKLRLSRATYNLNGTFASNGTYTTTVGGIPLNLQFDVGELTRSAYGQYNITGTYNGIAFTTYHALYNSTSNPAPQVGKYTVLLPAATGTDPSIPSGTGYTTLTVTEGGSVTIAGTLADGTIFTDGVYITGGSNALSNSFPIYAALGYGVAGAVTGSMTFEDNPGVSDCDGTMTWLKPAQTNSTFYKNGFTTSLAAIGSRYTQPPYRTLALNLANTSPNASILLSEPDFPIPIYHQLSITHGSNALTDTVQVTDNGADALTLSISASAGTFTGSFIHPVTGKSVNIKGALLYKQSRAAGFFLSPTQSGNVTIWP